MGSIAAMGFLAKFRWRAVVFGSAILLTGLFALFPERYLANSSFTPTDRDSLGLAETLGQLGAVSSVFGNQAAVEVALRISNSDAVRDQVIKTASLAEQMPGETRIGLQRYLRKKVEVRSLRGGIILIEMLDTDPDHASEIVSAYQTAIQAELARVSRRQTAYKRDLLKRLVKEASDELSVAEQAYDTFRLENRYSDPRGRITSLGERVTFLETVIRAKEVDLAKAREVFAENNLTIRQLEAEVSALRRQLAEARSVAPQQSQGVGELIENSSQLYRLERDLETAKALYNSYLRYLRGTSVEDLTADANVRILEQPHVETKRQYWLPGVALSIAFLLLWLAIEAYRTRPMASDRIFVKREPTNA
ncbi:MAG: hypothetical protein GW858_07650 [Sphingomonadales bacterium]|nr:hypothetical protein [Sphingomonadales bacterium]NCQ20384.1 hypothetical protein [Sphingomonadales bacterium]NCT02992.1 hypothetical protein [Sphingomonadales bacterium]